MREEGENGGGDLQLEVGRDGAMRWLHKVSGGSDAVKTSVQSGVVASQ